MSLLESIEIRTSDPELKILLSDIIAFWNSGLFPFQVISAVPTDTPSDVQIRLFDSGAGSVKLYVYSPTSATWKSVALT